MDGKDTAEWDDFLAAAMLCYTDNGDGTVTVADTGELQWEKKSDDGSLHDVDNIYTWDQAFTVHIAGLNTDNFAGHNDWRLPNIKEMQSIVNYGNLADGYPPAFNSGCVLGATVLGGSCTASSYWSSTTYINHPTDAGGVDLFGGYVGAVNKSNTAHVHAVRGGRRLSKEVEEQPAKSQEDPDWQYVYWIPSDLFSADSFDDSWSIQWLQDALVDLGYLQPMHPENRGLQYAERSTSRFFYRDPIFGGQASSDLQAAIQVLQKEGGISETDAILGHVIFGEQTKDIMLKKINELRVNKTAD